MVRKITKIIPVNIKVIPIAKKIGAKKRESSAMDLLLSGNFNHPKVKSSLNSAWQATKEDLPKPQFKPLMECVSFSVSSALFWRLFLPIIAVVIIILVIAVFLDAITVSAALVGAIILVAILVLLYFFSASVNTLYEEALYSTNRYIKEYMDSVAEVLPSCLEKGYATFTSELTSQEALEDLEQEEEFVV